MNLKQVLLACVALVVVIAISIFLLKSSDKTPAASFDVLAIDQPVEGASQNPNTQPYTPTKKIIEANLWEGDNIFRTVDPSLLDDSVVQQAIKDFPLNRFRVVDINADEIRQYMREPGSTNNIHLQLFEDLTIVGEPHEAKEFNEGQRAGFGSWRGTPEGEKSIISIVVAPDGITSIHIDGSRGSYTVSQLGNSPFHVVMDLSPTNVSYEGDTYIPTKN